MTDNIKWALRKMVNAATWMDDTTKKVTLQKISNTKTFFGYPENYTNVINNLFQDVRNILMLFFKHMCNPLFFFID